MSNAYKDIMAESASLYPVNLVKTGFAYWSNTLLEKTLGMFTYSGLPKSLPGTEIEKRLIYTGFAGIFDHKKYGIVTAYGSMFEMNEYYMPVKFLYTQPRLGSATLTINENVIVIYNAETDKYAPRGLWELIRRHARLLADIESSINIITVNSRATILPVAKDQTVAASYDSTMAQIALGKRQVVQEQNIIDTFRTVPYGPPGKNDSITDLLHARETILRSFLQEIGIHSSFEKRERLISDEVQSDRQLIAVNTSDMLRQRELGVEKLNEMFDLNVSVTISPEFEFKLKEDPHDDD